MLLCCMGWFFIKTPILANTLIKFPFDWNIESRLLWFNLSYVIVLLITAVKLNAFYTVTLSIFLIISIVFSFNLSYNDISSILTIMLILIVSCMKYKPIDAFILWVVKLGMPIYLLHFLVIDFIWQPVYIEYLQQFWFGNGYIYLVIAFIFVSFITMAISHIASKIPMVNLILFGDTSQIETVKTMQ